MSATALSAPPSPRTLDPRRWYALCLLCLAFFVIVLGSTTVFTAGPSLGRALGLTQAGLQWSFTAATLPAGALLLVGGRFADLFGRRRMFMLGLALLALASLGCGLAPSAAVLIAARAAQGASAALLMPAALSLVMSTFPEGGERNKALAAWSAIGGTGATAGLLLGGLVTAGLGWRWVFFINVPVAIVMLLLCPVLVREPGRGGGSRALDLAGALTITGGLALLIYGISEVPALGWLDPRTLGAVCLSVVVIAAFIRIESRARSPMLPLRLLRARTAVAGNLVLLTAGVTVDGLLFILTLYTQRVLGYSAVTFGLITAIMTVSSVGAAYLAQRAIGRLGARPVARSGLGMLVLTCLGFAAASAGGGSLLALAACMLLFGLGMGCAYVAGTVASLEGVPEQDSGIAAGVQNISFSLGTTLGVAALSTIAAAASGHVLSWPGTGHLAALAGGYRAAFIGGALLAALGLAATFAGYHHDESRD